MSDNFSRLTVRQHRRQHRPFVRLIGWIASDLAICLQKPCRTNDNAITKGVINRSVNYLRYFLPFLTKDERLGVGQNIARARKEYSQCP